MGGKVGSRWREGIFLGCPCDSNRFVLCNISGKTIVRARSVQRKSESARWNADALEEINQRPQDALYRTAAAPTGWRERGEGFERRDAPEDEEPKIRSSSIPDLWITLKDLRDFGSIDVGRQRCDYIRQHGDARRCGYAHSKICLYCIKRRLSEPPEGRLRLQRVEARFAKQHASEEQPRRELSSSHQQGEMRANRDIESEGQSQHNGRQDMDGDDDVPSDVHPDDDPEDNNRGDEDEADDNHMYTPDRSEPEGAVDEMDATLLEEDTPVERLLYFSAAEYETNAQARAAWAPNEETAKMIITPAESPSIMSQLPETGVYPAMDPLPDTAPCPKRPVFGPWTPPAGTLRIFQSTPLLLEHPFGAPSGVFLSSRRISSAPLDVFWNFWFLKPTLGNSYCALYELYHLPT